MLRLQRFTRKRSIFPLVLAITAWCHAAPANAQETRTLKMQSTWPASSTLQENFKFFADLYTNAEKETERKEHWDSAAQYAAYWDVLKENPGLSAFFEGSVRYESSVQLVAAGLLRMPAEYAQLVVAA